MVSLYSENETCYNKYQCEFIMHFDGVSLFDVIDFPYMIELDDISCALELFELLDTSHLRNDAASALQINAALLELISMFLENDVRDTSHDAKDNPFAPRGHGLRIIRWGTPEPTKISSLPVPVRM